jgi:uncharacterized coiled-coil DUF342 family protein
MPKLADQLQIEIDKADAKMREWKAQADQASAEGKKMYMEQMDELSQRRNQAMEQLSSLQEATSGAAGDMMNGAKSAFDRLRKALVSTESDRGNTMRW